VGEQWIVVDTLSLFGTAVALGMDAFAVGTAVAAALGTITFRHTFRLTWHFGLFQWMMTVLGWLGGEGLSTLLLGVNHWIAFGLLLGLGAKMIYESGRAENRAEGFDPTRGWSLVGLSVATSIDALAVGITFSLVDMSVWGPALVIGVAALLMTFVGMRLGKTAGEHLGQWAERIGGAVLIVIGARILMEHMIR
jgi:putative Mn2+ efflux pump MntP